ncbi:small G protein signaling modulator 2-like [Watersipora subatra]|uniref:small G protein signaling modulator 2-like n=1 Tax=Watersipora subatra TaxID=2589382 RepID=UPI00355BF530
MTAFAMFRRQANVDPEFQGDVVDNLLSCVKRQVKQIMEESVTKKFIHEDSSSITTLCGAVEACLKYKMKRQLVNLFSNTSSTTFLLHRVAKTLDEAKETSRAVAELEGGTDALSRFSLKGFRADSSNTSPSHQRNGHHKYAWIRMALQNKVLAKIVAYLVANSSKYYEPASLLADQSKGRLLAELLDGPCALEYSKIRTTDHLYTDPNADELVLRHRLHSSTSVVSQSSGSSPHRRPALGLGKARCNTSSSSEDSARSVPMHAREYVDSLHQNFKAKLLYGKNNVKVLPRDGDSRLPGYLSLHQTSTSLSLKWTPNQLISSNSTSGNSTSGSSSETVLTPTEDEPSFSDSCYVGKTHKCQTTSANSDPSHNPRLMTKPLELLWDCAITVNIDEIVYLHCHHQGSCGGSLILVGMDGVQSPAFHFPFGGHLLAFLTCLESGLQPHAHLDPPLWIHRDTVEKSSILGKIFPKVRKRPSKHLSSEGGDLRDTFPINAIAEDVDYVFRIVLSCKPAGLHKLIDGRIQSFPSLGFRLPWAPAKPGSDYALDCPNGDDNYGETTLTVTNGEAISKPPLKTKDSLQRLCETMKLRILSRAFYGWLAHCRHLKTVREHLSGLVYSNGATLPVPPENEKCLTSEFWSRLSDTDKVFLQFEIYRRIYYGGMSHDIRKQVWPYLLGHYKFGCTKSERRRIDLLAQRNYEVTKDEWMSVEAVIKERNDKSKVCRMASESDEDGDEHCECSSVASMPELVRNRSLQRQTSALSNDVFLDTVIVGEVGSEELSLTTRPHPPLTKWHTVDSNYREDFCSVKMSNTFGGQRRYSSDGNIETESSPLVRKDSYQNEKLLEEVDQNLHRIDKDVHRCDRTYWYFTENNLKKLRNVMCTYVWKNLEVGYVQGMCDLVAPLLVIFDDESLTYSCFCELMKRMVYNFPNGGAMDNHIANMRSLIRVLDPELHDLMHHDDEFSHFYFCYRWLLLDFKREMCYDDVFLVWESIWSAKHITSDNYVAFIALAMIESYRDILLDNSMDFTDVIKFFNEMAEKHDAKEVLSIARDLVYKLQKLIETK